MTDGFDPYHSWLGIPPRHQPPNHYRLLGLQMFESDVDVIANTFSRQMSHVRTFQTGQHSALSQQILNEIANAKVCLLNPQKKASYDQQLRVQQQSRLAPKKPRITQATPLPVATSSSVAAAPTIVTDAASAPSARTSGSRSVGGPSRGRPAKTAWKSPLLIAGACGAVTVLLIAVVVVSVQVAPKEKQEVAKRGDGGDASQSGGNGKSNVLSGERGTRADSDPPGRSKTNDAEPLEPFDRKPAAKESGEKQADDGNGKIEVDPPQENKQKPAPPILAVVAKKMPIPDADAVAAAKEEIGELFELGKKRTRADKSAVANDLVDGAVEEATNTPEHFAILSIGRELAASAGALDTALLAIKRLDAVYIIDAWQMRLSTMQSVTRTVSKSDTAAVDQIVMQCSKQIDAAARDDRYDIATSLAALAAVTGRQAATDKNALAELIQSTKRRKGQFEKVAPAIQTLKTDPEDPDANLAVGRFRCLNQDDWKRGLPHLARGSDTALRVAAEGDLRNPTAAEARSDVGDAWWEAAQAARSEQRRAYLTRANHWYKRADLKLKGLKKLRVTQRLKDFAAFAVEDIKRQEKAALDEMLRRSKPRRGMVGFVTVDGKDSGLVLTYQLGKRFAPEKLAAALARYDKQGSAVSVEFLGVYQLETTSSLYVLVQRGTPTRGSESLLFMPGRRLPMSSGRYGRYTTLVSKAGLLAFRWVMPQGQLSNGQLNIQQLRNGVKGDQIEIVFTSKMLKTLKARRARALIDVSGI